MTTKPENITEKGLPASLCSGALLGALREMHAGDPVKAWIGTDGVACCLMFPHHTEAEFSNDGTPGEWLHVELDEPKSDESAATVAARNWLTKFLAS